jgi:hypothetical protein
MMATRLAKKPEIVEHLTPSFAVGCRRLTPGPGYLEALVEPNVNFISTPISSINHAGVLLSDNTQVDLDVLVCATGFKTNSPPPFGVTGRNSTTLQQRFLPFPTTYLSLAVDSFPNYFMMLGPNAAIGSGSLTTMLEAQGDYITKCIRKLQKEDYASMEPKANRVRDFTEYVGKYFEKTVYMDECNSWYRSEGGKGNRITGLWPGSTLHALETLRSPRWEDWDYTPLDEAGEQNRLRWLGNGWSVCQIADGGDPAFYLNGDVIDVPKEGKPEEDARHRARPFSH